MNHVSVLLFIAVESSIPQLEINSGGDAFDLDIDNASSFESCESISQFKSEWLIYRVLLVNDVRPAVVRA